MTYTISFAGVQNENIQLREFMNVDNNEVSKVCPYKVVKSWKMFRENTDVTGLFGIKSSV